MLNTTQIAPNQLVVTFEDVTMIPGVKKAISLMKGVKSVASVRAKRVSAFERSRQEVEAGQLYTAANLEDLFAQLND